MRKCEACRYLAFGDGDDCKHCGAAMPSAEPAMVPAAAGV
jgi:hypothetical protein